MLQSHTLVREAFEHFNSATIKVETYHRTQDLSYLERALNDLEKSIESDPNYFQPFNYKGIIFDLKGLSSSAIREFDSLERKPLSRELYSEVKYNRAVANFHLYKEPYMLKAIAELEDLNSDESLSPRLFGLVKASLSQAYGMMVLHAQKKTEAEVINNYERSILLGKEAINYIEIQRKNLGKDFEKNTIWIAYNAQGISAMFRNDLKLDTLSNKDRPEVQKSLQYAIKKFKKGLENSPKNWALICNLGSSYLRLGYILLKSGKTDLSKKKFLAAEKLFKEVVTYLRPNYDFAFYEIGRIYRLQNQMESAKDYFDKARVAGRENPNLSVETLTKNIQATLSDNTRFNLISLAS